MNDNGPENIRRYRSVLIVIDNFSKFVWTVPLKNKNAQTIKNSSESNRISSTRKPNIYETDRGKEFYNSIFQNFLNNNNFKRYSRNIYPGAVFAERFKKSRRNILKNPVFEQSDANWIDVLPTIAKQCKNGVHSSTKLKPLQASLKKNDGYVYQNLLDKRKKKTEISSKRFGSSCWLWKNVPKRRYNWLALQII